LEQVFQEQLLLNRYLKIGFNVTVVEGRNRVGGRINTNYRGMSVPVEQGAHWIHGIKGNPIVNLAKKYKVNSTLSDYDNM
jgi:monoamine oxidase